MNEKPIMKNAKGFNTVYMYSLKGNPRYGLDLIPLRAFQTGKLPKRFCEILQIRPFNTTKTQSNSDIDVCRIQFQYTLR